MGSCDTLHDINKELDGPTMMEPPNNDRIASKIKQHQMVSGMRWMEIRVFLLLRELLYSNVARCEHKA